MIFKVFEEVRYLIILVFFDLGIFFFMVEVGVFGILVEVFLMSIKVFFGGKGSYVFVFFGLGRVKFGVEGFLELVGWKFYFGESEVEEFNVDGLV